MWPAEAAYVDLQLVSIHGMVKCGSTIYLQRKEKPVFFSCELAQLLKVLTNPAWRLQVEKSLQCLAPTDS